MRRWCEQAVKVWHAWRVQAMPLPRVRADIGRWVPGWVFRLVAALVAGVTAGLGLALRGHPLAAGIAAAIWVVWTALAPGVGSWAGCIVVAAAVQLVAGPPAAAVWVALLGYATCRATWWAGHIRPRGRVSVRALGRAGARDVAVLVVVAAVAALAWWLGGLGWTPVGADVALVVGTAAVVGLGVAVAALLRRAS